MFLVSDFFSIHNINGCAALFFFERIIVSRKLHFVILEKNTAQQKKNVKLNLKNQIKADLRENYF